MSLEEKIRLYKELGQQIEALEEQKKNLVTEILSLIPQETKSLEVADYQVKRMVRLSIKTSLEQAREWGAVKIETVIDKKRIKELYGMGNPIPDVTESEFIQVSLKKEKI